jgi:hypothetical protein
MMMGFSGVIAVFAAAPGRRRIWRLLWRCLRRAAAGCPHSTAMRPGHSIISGLETYTL